MAWLRTVNSSPDLEHSALVAVPFATTGRVLAGSEFAIGPPEEGTGNWVLWAVLPADLLLLSRSTGDLSRTTPFRQEFLVFDRNDRSLSRIATLDDFRTLANVAVSGDSIVWVQTHPQIGVGGAELVTLNLSNRQSVVVATEVESSGTDSLAFASGNDEVLFRTTTMGSDGGFSQTLVAYDLATTRSEVVYEAERLILRPLAFDGTRALWSESNGTAPTDGRLLFTPDVRSIAPSTLRVGDAVYAAAFDGPGLYLKGARGVWFATGADEPAQLIWQQEGIAGWSPFALARGLLAWTGVDPL